MMLGIFWREVERLGCYLTRANNGPPGWRTLRRSNSAFQRKQTQGFSRPSSNARLSASVRLVTPNF
jgi:hypothetical protein